MQNGFEVSSFLAEMPPREREANLVAFQETKGSTRSAVLLMNYSVAAIGLNLTAAKSAVLYMPATNEAEEQQAKNRIHRMGQTDAMTVIR